MFLVANTRRWQLGLLLFSWIIKIFTEITKFYVNILTSTGLFDSVYTEPSVYTGPLILSADLFYVHLVAAIPSHGLLRQQLNNNDPDIAIGI